MGEKKKTPTLDSTELAQRAVEIARKHGAAEAGAVATRNRSVEVRWRDGKLEQLNEATTRGLSVELFVDGRYSAVETSDVRPEALDRFLADAVALARVLAPDEHRRLPDAALFAGQAKVDLELEDPAQAKISPDDRKRWASDLYGAAKSADSRGIANSISGGFQDDWTEIVKVTSNGFSGSRRMTSFSAWADCSVTDKDGRRPEDGDWATVRRLADLPAAAKLGAEATRRTYARLGAIKAKSASMTLVIDNRTAGRAVGSLMAPLSGASLQQKRSFLDGKLGQTIGSAKLTLTDDPHVVRGIGSRLWDGEGMATKRRPVFDKGVLKTYFIDSYYARKLGVAPTTGGASNLVFELGDKSQAALIADVKDGIFVTGFLGGNNNPATGDFSLGIQGFRIQNGQLAEPIGEMNIAGNGMEFWKRLAVVGNDPWPYGSSRMPTLVFDGVSVAGV